MPSMKKLFQKVSFVVSAHEKKILPETIQSCFFRLLLVWRCEFRSERLLDLPPYDDFLRLVLLDRLLVRLFFL